MKSLKSGKGFVDTVKDKAKDIVSAVFQKNEFEPEVGAKKKLSTVS